MYKLGIVIVSFTLCLACKHEVGLTMERKSEIEETVKQTLLNYYQAVETGGLLEEFKYLDSTRSFFWVPPGFSTAISYDSVSKILKLNAPMVKSIKSIFDTLYVQALSESHAVYYGRLRSVVTSSAGLKQEVLLQETGLLVNRNDGWKLLNGHTSNVSK